MKKRTLIAAASLIVTLNAWAETLFAAENDRPWPPQM